MMNNDLLCVYFRIIYLIIYSILNYCLYVNSEGLGFKSFLKMSLHEAEYVAVKEH